MSSSIVKVGVAAAAVLALAQAAEAAPKAKPSPEAAEIAAMRQQLDAMRADYETRIGDLERRLKAAEDRAVAPAATPPAPAQPSDVAPGEVVINEPGDTQTAEAAPPPAEIAPAAPTAVATANGNAMNPGVSVVLNGNYAASSRDPTLARIAGYPLSDEARLFPKGFSLGESEVTLAANVDPFLTAQLTASFGRDDSVSVEEAYIQSTALPGGLTLKGGRFFSGIGYLNERHAHNWSFIDMPLPYRALLGVQYGDDGVQLRWLTPAPFFLEVGGELFRGDHFPAGVASKSRAGAQTAFLHTGGDLSTSSSWLGALSYIHTEAHARPTDDLAGGADVFSGDDRLAIASLVYKWAPGGNPTERNLTLSGEYFFGHQRGTFDGLPVNRDQDGWYAQGVYQFAKGWSAGLRYAALGDQGVGPALRGTALDGFGRTPRAISGLLEFDTSEFGRFRAQYTRDLSDLRANDEILFQYTIVYGPHGAHRY